MNVYKYSEIIGINESRIIDLKNQITKVCNAHLDKAEFDWKKTNATNRMASDESLHLEHASQKFQDSMEASLIPGYEKVSLFDPKIDDFIAIVCDIRNSTDRLQTNRNGFKNIERDNGIQRVFYETSAMLPSLETTINFFKGQVTEYLGDGILGFIQYKDKQEIYDAYHASKACVTLTRDIVNNILFDRYNLPKLDIGVGLALSPAMIRVVTKNHIKAFGQCVWRATKLSGGINTVEIDMCLKNKWPKSQNGLRFIEHKNKYKQDKVYKVYPLKNS
jgi:hypothetical protein